MAPDKAGGAGGAAAAVGDMAHPPRETSGDTLGRVNCAESEKSRRWGSARAVGAAWAAGGLGRDSRRRSKLTSAEPSPSSRLGTMAVAVVAAGARRLAASRSQSEVDEPRDVTDGTVTAGLAALAMPAFWAVWADDGAEASGRG